MEANTLAAVLAGVGALMVALAVPMMRGRIPPNHWYGVRTPKSLSTPERWYAMNRFGGKALLVAGVVQIAVACALPFSVVDSSSFSLWAITPVPIALGAFAACLVHSARHVP